MNKSLTEHVQSEEFEKAVFQWAHDCGIRLRGDAFEPIFKANFLSQLKTIELVKKELEGMKNEMPYPNANNGWQKELEDEEKGFNSALSQAITLLDTIIQDLKSQKIVN